MTGPLAQQIAQVREPLEQTLREVEALTEGMPPERAELYLRVPLARLAALSAIERHVQDMETALAHTSERLDSLRRYRESQEGLPIGTLGNAVWENSPALPAREKGTE